MPVCCSRSRSRSRVKPNLKPKSYETYEQAVRNHLRPRLGSKVML
ncbi:hypothetical protein AB0393_27875, partial [Streptomyces cyaneofuscatus]